MCQMKANGWELVTDKKFLQCTNILVGVATLYYFVGCLML